MQGIGYILIGEEKIKVLWRSDLKTSVFIKLRKSGQDGKFLSDESEYLTENQEAISRLRAGQVLCL